MADIKLLKHPFNMCEVKHAPSYLAPYSFVISMPNRLTLICPADETPKTHIMVTESCSCFILEEENAKDIMKATSALSEILTSAGVESTVMLVKNTSYIFVSTDKAMDTVMLLSRLGYDVKYSDFF